MIWTAYVDLGVNECETCGYTPEEINIQTEDFRTFSARVSVGCYGGGATHGGPGEIASWLRKEWGHLDEVSEAVAGLESMEALLA